MLKEKSDSSGNSINQRSEFIEYISNLYYNKSLQKQKIMKDKDYEHFLKSASILKCTNGDAENYKTQGAKSLVVELKYDDIVTEIEKMCKDLFIVDSIQVIESKRFMCVNIESSIDFFIHFNDSCIMLHYTHIEANSGYPIIDVVKKMLNVQLKKIHNTI